MYVQKTKKKRDDKYLTSYPDNVHDVHTEKEGHEVFAPVENLWMVASVNYNGAFTLDVKSMLNENLGGILGGTQS
jgi:hypothetical protein